jgi:hypothetical protein
MILSNTKCNTPFKILQKQDTYICTFLKKTIWIIRWKKYGVFWFKKIITLKSKLKNPANMSNKANELKNWHIMKRDNTK